MTEEDKAAATALRLMGKTVRDFGGTMKVETYEVEPLAPEPQIEIEAIELIDKLGLAGQKKLVATESNTPDTIPYKELSKSEVVVFKEVFSKQEEVKEYSQGVMPVRVLQVAAHGIDIFDKTQVWYREEGAKDAALIGIDGPYSREKYFLLARWGDVLLDYEALVKEARVNLRDSYEKQLKDCAEKCQEKLRNIDSMVDSRIKGDTIYLPS